MVLDSFAFAGAFLAGTFLTPDFAFVFEFFEAVVLVFAGDFVAGCLVALVALDTDGLDLVTTFLVTGFAFA